MSRDERFDTGGSAASKKLLTGEEEFWFDIAERIHCSPSEAKWKTPVGEFIRWQERIRKDWNKPDKVIWHLAQIAFEIARLEHTVAHILSQRPPFKKTVQDFILKFTEGPAVKTGSEKEETLQQKIEKSKNAARTMFRNKGSENVVHRALSPRLLEKVQKLKEANEQLLNKS